VGVITDVRAFGVTPESRSPAVVVSQERRHPVRGGLPSHIQGSGSFEVVLVGPFNCRSRRAARGPRAPVNNRQGDWV